jgi:UDP-N-acetylglucosamine transferase subunit ALG13
VILASVGTQLPFPRLIRALDTIAGAQSLEIVAQTAEKCAWAHHITVREHVAPVEFELLVRRATCLVGHAGIGTVLTAKRHAKPLIIFPRQASLGEHRNDHQLATARELQNRRGIYVAWDENDLRRLLLARAMVAPHSETSEKLPSLLQRIQRFIHSESR